MSTVLMCDSCGQLFSVNDKGWRQLTERIDASENNAHNQGMKALHTGPCCLFSEKKVVPAVGGLVRELEAAPDAPETGWKAMHAVCDRALEHGPHAWKEQVGRTVLDFWCEGVSEDG